MYAWYFRTFPSFIPTAGCLTYSDQRGDLTLLYVGISPKAPARSGVTGLPGKASSQTLRHRIRYHYNGNAEGSTLRLSLGVLLQEELGIELRRVGSGVRMTFGAGEKVLSEWMAANAFVTWMETEEPWKVEEELIATLSLPLNLDQNRNHVFHAELSRRRSEAKQRARVAPISST